MDILLRVSHDLLSTAHCEDLEITKSNLPALCLGHLVDLDFLWSFLTWLLHVNGHMKPMVYLANLFVSPSTMSSLIAS